MSEYNFKEIEDKFKDKWYESNVCSSEDPQDGKLPEKPKKYILAELPYPSGYALHAGHMMRYTVPEVYSRYLRMKGYNVMYPMGWDAFGLPAETFAIEKGIHPAVTTEEAIKNFKKSLIDMGYGFDWAREFSTADPQNYKWTQWMFLKLWKRGLAELREMPVWWCENLKTVLADEEVLTDENGDKISERKGHPVERKMLKQWVLKIPEYAEKLLGGLEKVEFTEAIKTAQRNWIGKSEGATIEFEVDGGEVSVFTTCADTIFGVTFLALAPEHPVLEKLLERTTNRAEVEEYIEKASALSDLEKQMVKEKTGVKLEGISAKHPFDEVSLEIPVFVTNYVLMDYGTGALMGVPAHDERDNEFAKKYGLEIIEVIKPKEESGGAIYVGEGVVVNSGEYDGMNSEEFKKVVAERLEKEGKGKADVTYRMRDQIFSRQRYWGEPIPLIHKQDGTVEAICDPDNLEEVNKVLPLELPDVPDYRPASGGASPLARNEEWVNTTDSDGKPAKRETDTMPTWAGSNWYFLRYIDPKNETEFADQEKLKYWLPVDKYYGDAGHTTMHLLYSRFWHRFLYDEGDVPTPEPYAWRLNGGLLLGPDGRKMSKSFGNIVDPIEVVENYGADATRLFLCFLGPYTDTYPWNDSGIKSCWRLMKNVFELKDKVNKLDGAQKDSEEVRTLNKSSRSNDHDAFFSRADPQERVLTLENRKYHVMVRKVTEMCEALKMNTAVSEFMIFVNAAKKVSAIDADIWNGFVRLLAPFAPFIAEELWQEINGRSADEWTKENSVHLADWPTYDEELAKEVLTKIPVQVNGKLRDHVELDADDTDNSVRGKVLELEKVKRHIEGREVTNVVYVPGKVVNVVAT